MPTRVVGSRGHMHDSEGDLGVDYGDYSMARCWRGDGDGDEHNLGNPRGFSSSSGFLPAPAATVARLMTRDDLIPDTLLALRKCTLVANCAERTTDMVAVVVACPPLGA